MKLLRSVLLCGLVVLAGWIAIVLWHFPWAVDSPTSREVEMKGFYAMVYAPTPNTVYKPTALAKPQEQRKTPFIFAIKLLNSWRTTILSTPAHWK